MLVRSDGAALAFGHNGAGQCEIPDLPEASLEIQNAAQVDSRTNSYKTLNFRVQAQIFRHTKSHPYFD